MRQLIAMLALLLAALAQPAAAQDGLAQNGRGPVLSGPLLGANERLLIVPRGQIDLERFIRDGEVLRVPDGADLSGLLRPRTRGAGYVTGRVFLARDPVEPVSLSAIRPRPSLVPADLSPIPEVEVTLRNAGTGAEFGPYLTTMSGVFVSQRVPPGPYVICIGGAGWNRTCDEIRIDRDRVHLPHALIAPAKGRTGSIRGRVSLADDGFPNVHLAWAGLLDGARVTAFAQNGQRLGQARANALGDYVLPALPAGAPVRLVASFEGASAVDQVPFGTVSQGAFLRRDIVLANARPVAVLSQTRAGGVAVASVDPGATVRAVIEAEDPDGDPVQVSWFPDPGAGTVSAPTGGAVDWTLPGMPGAYTLRAVLSDGRGGYLPRSFHVDVGGGGELFTGTVLSTRGGTLGNVAVSVNGQEGTTNANGRFELRVAAAERYVLNIRSPDHAFFSQVYGQATRGGRYTLVPATVQRFDPGADIEITDRRTDRDCRGAPSANLVWEGVPGIRREAIRPDPVRADRKEPQAQDRPNATGGREFARFLDGWRQRGHKRDCGPGASLRIPAGSLVDAEGNPPPGLVDVAISTYDIEAEMEMPGDWTVAPEGSVAATGSMESYGAAFVEIRDGQREYNLAEGASAELVIPVAPGQLDIGAPLKPVIPIFHYDETRGVWNRTGEAELQGLSYVAKVAHFSAINADVEKQTPACIHLRVESGGAMPSQLGIEVTIPADPGSGAAARVRSGLIDASVTDDHVIYNLPENRPILIVAYDPAGDVALGTFVVDSGGAHGAASNPPPHTSCQGSALIAIPDAPPQLPAGVEYLQGLSSFFAYDLGNGGQYAADLADATADYYAQVDPLSNRRDTFGQFKDVWGFDGTEANARYANSADLGFGRDMHCTSRDIDADGTEEVACYVSNYGIRQDDDQDNANWASQQDPTRYVATVAMEFAPVENPGTEASPTFNQGVGDIVKFFVYGPDPDPAADTDGDGIAADNDEGGLVSAADLDGFGARPIPQLCMVCHGGTLPNDTALDSNGDPTPGPLPIFGSAADVDLGSRFLPFDLDSYTFPDSGPVQGTQEAAFKTLNLDYVMNTDVSGAIDEVVGAFYGPGGAAPVQNRGFVIAGWSGSPAEQEAYRHVVGPNCRICHVAHDGIGRTFQSAASLPPGLAGYYACVARSMPHSVRTYQRFWTSLNPSQPGQLVNWLFEQGADPSQCTFPPNNGGDFPLP